MRFVVELFVPSMELLLGCKRYLFNIEVSSVPTGSTGYKASSAETY